MAPSVEAIVKDYNFKPELVERISLRKRKETLEIVPPDPSWPQVFEQFNSRIVAALGDTALVVHHAGSTSVPGLPAKNVIDIDLVVADITDEAAFVPALEEAGFHFLLREPHWHEHRFFCAYEPQPANLHVWGPDTPEVERHRIFREWLLQNDDDRALYAEIKKEAARQTTETGGVMMDYNFRKDGVIRQILQRAFKELGYVQ